MQKPQVVYPCIWPYRVIGVHAEVIEREICNRLQSAYRFEVECGNVSRQGNYVALHVAVSVADEVERNTVYSLLKAITGVKMVF